MAARRPKVYVSGALNAAADIERSKRFYERVGEVCGEVGLDAYVPHTMGTDPIENPDVTPEEVYRRDMAAVSASDLIVAYVGEPSLGVGSEIERASAEGIDVILLYERGRKVSRLILGAPTVCGRVAFSSEADAMGTLRERLRAWARKRGWRGFA